MFCKIQRQINKPNGLSEDKIVYLIEEGFSKNYRLTRISGSLLRLRRFYYFKTNGWGHNLKQLEIRDRCFVKFENDLIILFLDLTKQILVTLISSAIFFIMLWKGYSIYPIASILITLFLDLILWIVIIHNGKRFVNSMILELNESIN